ncbi:MAG: LysR substrate-binding domain-containing protein [Gammaproteobacteria bacterium]
MSLRDFFNSLLKQHQCLLYTYAESAKYWSLVNKAGEKKQIPISGSLQANNGNLICDAMVQGLGIALLPTFIAGDAIKTGGAKILLPEWHPQPPNISLLYPSNKHLSAKVRAFVDMAVEHFSDKEL